MVIRQWEGKDSVQLSNCQTHDREHNRAVKRRQSYPPPTFNKWMNIRCPNKNIVICSKSDNGNLSCQASHRAPFFKEKLILKGAVTCLSVFWLFLPPWQCFLLSGFIPNSIIFKEGSEREMGSLSTLLGPGVGPEECISLSHKQFQQLTAEASSPLHRGSSGGYWDDDLYGSLILSLSCSVAHFLRAVHSEGPRAPFWTTARIWYFWMAVHIFKGHYPFQQPTGTDSRRQ